MPTASPSMASAASAAASCAPPSSARPTSRSSPSTTSPTSRRSRICSRFDSVYGRFPGAVTVRDGIIDVDGRRSSPPRYRDPAELPWAGLRRRRRDRGHRALPHPRPRPRKHLEAGAQQGDPLGARSRAPSPPTRTSCSASTTTSMTRAPPHRHQRVVHDELPRAGGQGPARDGRDPARPDDHDPRLHGRPEPARRPAQGSAPRPRGRAEPRPDLDRRRQGARARDPRARRQAAGLRGARARPRPGRSST